MPKNPRRPRDPNQLAKFIVEMTTDYDQPIEVKPEKNAAAVSLVRLGGLKGGKARADKLSPEKRQEIAKAAAAKRWESNS